MNNEKLMEIIRKGYNKEGLTDEENLFLLDEAKRLLDSLDEAVDRDIKRAREALAEKRLREFRLERMERLYSEFGEAITNVNGRKAARRLREIIRLARFREAE